jgi:hypothetical protein
MSETDKRQGGGKLLQVGNEAVGKVETTIAEVEKSTISH